MSAVLKLVQAQQFSEQLEVDLQRSSSDSHSLQSALLYSSPWQPALARYVIERFSKRGSTVLDPLCATGTVGVESVLSGRSFVGCAQDHGMVKLARSRLRPADLAEVALRLQFINFKKPVDIRGYREPFPFFYDADTFRELMNVKTTLRGAGDPAAEFILFIVASILHGHTAGHLSAYSSPSAGLSPEAQASLNRKRGEVPSYRALSARILKKAALLLRDGVPSVLQDSRAQRDVVHAEPSALNGVVSGSVDLALVAPDQPGVFEHGLHSWLRSWWLGVDVPSAPRSFQDVAEWREYSNEILVELARVVQRGGRAVIRVGQGRIGTKVTSYARELEGVISTCLPKFWQIEGSISERFVEPATGSGARKDRSGALPCELVVLRRA